MAVASKSVSAIVERIVYGYVRRIESESSVTIPLDIKHIVVWFAMIEFISMARTDHFKIENNGMTVTNIKQCDYKNHTIICNQSIDSTMGGIFKWKFEIKMNEKATSSSIYFGFTTEKFDKLDKDFKQNWNSYAINNKGVMWRGRVLNIKYQNDIRYTFNNGDVVTLILNTMNKHTSIQVNDKKEQMIHQNVRKAKRFKIKMVIQLKNVGDSVTLLKYSERMAVNTV